MRLRIGTSGYSYTAWRGAFYPQDLKPAGFLGFYAERFEAVEINNTFYRMPKRDVLERWCDQVGEGFRFALKAPQRITHLKRLKDATGELDHLLEVSEALGGRRGPLLFQLPPYLRQDLPRLTAFLEALPAEVAAAFEFRHPSWNDEAVHAALRERGVALCLADTADAPRPALVTTADWAYLRLRRCDYTDADLEGWVERLRGAGLREAWVMFKHEDEATGPALAERMAGFVSSPSHRAT